MLTGKRIQQPLPDCLTTDPLLSVLPSKTMARLAGSVDEVRFGAGEVLCRLGEPAGFLYLLERGEVTLTTPAGRQQDLLTRHCGLESVAGLDDYAFTLTAVTEVTAWSVPRTALAEAVSREPRLAADAIRSLLYTMTGEPTPPAKARSVPPDASRSYGSVVSWMIATTAPPLLYWGLATMGLPAQSALYIAIMGLVVLLWMLAIVDEFIPPLIGVVATLFAGLAPASIALGGFASSGLMTAISVFALASIISSSGLSYRLMLWLMSRLPDRPIWQQSVLLLSGMVLSPIVPAGNSRLSILLPLYTDMIKGLHLEPRSMGMTALMAATVSGSLLFAPLMATSKPASITAITLLPLEVQRQFAGSYWLVAASVAAVGLLLLHYLLMRWLLPATNPRPLPKVRISGQLGLLGPLSFPEWMALGSIAALLLGTATVSLHHVQPPWIGGCILISLLVMGVLSKQDFRRQIDWSLVFYLIGADSMVRIMTHLGVDDALSRAVGGYFGFINGRIEVFVLVVLMTTTVLRVGLPGTASALISTILLIPVAEANGIHPWISLFLCMLFSDIWFAQYQNSAWIQVVSRGLAADVDVPKFMRYIHGMNLARVLVAFLSIPYWKWLQLQ